MAMANTPGTLRRKSVMALPSEANTLVKAPTREDIEKTVHDDHRLDMSLAWGVGETEGWRPTMEDAYVAMGSLSSSGDKLEDSALFAVFDGHGGSLVSKFCAEALPKVLLNNGASDPSAALRDSFLRMDQLLDAKGKEMSLTELENPMRIGSTAVACLVRPDAVIVANAGDSRAVLSRNGSAVDLSNDHKPHLPDEQARITKAGGKVRVQRYGSHSISRLNCALSVSRGMGDLRFKRNLKLSPEEQVLSCVPEMKVCSRTEEDEFLVIACDGVWDMMSSQDVVDFVMEYLPALRCGSIAPSDVVLKIFEKCISYDPVDYLGTDNMTMVLVVFGISGLHPQCYKSFDAEDLEIEQCEEVNCESGTSLANCLNMFGSYVDSAEADGKLTPKLSLKVNLADDTPGSPQHRLSPKNIGPASPQRRLNKASRYASSPAVSDLADSSEPASPQRPLNKAFRYASTPAVSDLADSETDPRKAQSFINVPLQDCSEEIQGQANIAPLILNVADDDKDGLFGFNGRCIWTPRMWSPREKQEAEPMHDVEQAPGVFGKLRFYLRKSAI
jgi:serine/threonine protein phosphatase PrpC